MTNSCFSFDYGGIRIKVQVIRRDRRTLEISVYPDMKVITVAPLNATDDDILIKVKKRAHWIKKQLRFFHQFHPRTPERQYVSGETHLYLGRQYRLRVRYSSNKKNRVRLLRGYIEVHSYDPKRPTLTKELTEAWYKEHAHKKFNERLEICLNKFPNSENYKPRSVIIRRMKKRWGSMTPSSRLILNLDLIRAPIDAIDYVITHELCHIVHNHHGVAFINLLERIMPDWEKRKTMLEKILA